MKFNKIFFSTITLPLISVPPIVATTGCSCSSTLLSQTDLGRQCANLLVAAPLTSLANLNYVDITKYLKQADMLVENLDNKNAITTTPEKSDDADYKNKMKVVFKSKDQTVKLEFTMYYSDITTEIKEKSKEIKIKQYFYGKVIFKEKTYFFTSELKNKEEIKETKSEVEFTLYNTNDSEKTNYIKLKYEKETEWDEIEHEYKYEVYNNGSCVEHSIKIELERDETKVKIEQESKYEEIEAEFKRVVKDNSVIYHGGKDGTYVRQVDKSGVYFITWPLNNLQ